MRICFNIVEDWDSDPTPAHIIITDEIKPEKLYIVYIPFSSQIRKRLTRKMIKQGIDSGIYYLYSIDHVFDDDGGLRVGIIEEMGKHLKEIINNKIETIPRRWRETIILTMGTVI